MSSPGPKKKKSRHTRNNVAVIPKDREAKQPRILVVVESSPSAILNFPFLILTLEGLGLENAKGLSQTIIDFNRVLHLVSDNKLHEGNLASYMNGGGESQMPLKYDATKAFIPAFIATHALNNGHLHLTKNDFQVISTKDFVDVYDGTTEARLDFDVLIVTHKSIADLCLNHARQLCGTSKRGTPIRIFPPIAHLRFVLDQYAIIADKVVVPIGCQSRPLYTKIPKPDLQDRLKPLPSSACTDPGGFYYTWMIVDEGTQVLVKVTSKNDPSEGPQEMVLDTINTINNANLFKGFACSLTDPPSVEDNVPPTGGYSKLLSFITRIVEQEVIYVAPQSTNVFTGNCITIYAHSPLNGTKATQFIDGMYYNVFGDGNFECHSIKSSEWDKLTHHSRSVPYNKCKKTYDSKHNSSQQTAKYYAERAYEAKSSVKLLLHQYSTLAGNESSHLPFRIVMAEYITKDTKDDEKVDKCKSNKGKYVLNYTPLSVLPSPLYNSGSVTNCMHVNNSVQRDFRISGLIYDFIQKNYAVGCWGI